MDFGKRRLGKMNHRVMGTTCSWAVPEYFSDREMDAKQIAYLPSPPVSIEVACKKNSVAFQVFVRTSEIYLCVKCGHLMINAKGR